MKGTSKPEIVPARRAHEYREAFLEAVTPEDVRAIGTALLEKAKAGDQAAAKLVLDRVLGSAEAERWPSRLGVERDVALDEKLSRYSV